MQLRKRDFFTTIKTEGSILPPDLLQRIAGGDPGLGGLGPLDYHLAKNERPNEVINRSWNRLQGVWSAFRAGLNKLPPSDPATTVTRERWLLILFQELGYGRLQAARTVLVGGKNYAISHGWQHTPIHLVGCRVDLDHKSAGVAGAARTSPHSLMQDFLNRSPQHLWGMVSNGLVLRILRESASLTRQSYVEFDLAGMMDGEIYADFALFWLLCHQSRLEGERPDQCWLEKWSQTAYEQGARVLDQLRNGVEQAINILGRGFLAHPANRQLRARLQSGQLTTLGYYRQLLRLVYRLIFLFVAEERDLLLHPAAPSLVRERYQRYYSLGRLRRLAERLRGTKHADLCHGLWLVMEKLEQDGGCPELGLPPLGSFLWSPKAAADLGGCEIINRELLDAIRALTFITDNHIRRPVDYKNLGAEELGSVYESLLEMHPVIDIGAGSFFLDSASGSERKTTGSYYTPASLINCLLDSALKPVLEAAFKEKDPEAAILNLKICDPACGSGHFLIAAAHQVAKRLASVRTGDDEPSPVARRTALRDVIGRCIYGVDLNEMAVELCKVSLWMETLEPGKPLSFLDHRILCGNSLLGATPALLAGGIPDEAFNPIEGDTKEISSKHKRQNRQERETKQGTLLFDDRGAWKETASVAGSMARINEIKDDTPADIRRKEDWYRQCMSSAGYLNSKLLADAWCAAFVWKKTKAFPYPITQEVLYRIKKNPGGIPGWMQEEILRLARRYQFFHWHLAFPEVFPVLQDEPPGNSQAGWSGGFDVVLGNPPWERVKLQEKEWFAVRAPEIAKAANAAARKRMIGALAADDPGLYREFIEDLRKSEGESHYVRNSGRFPLCGRGDINTYAVFAETMRLILGGMGRVGCIVPSGIATDDTTKYFFQDLMDTASLASLYDFENRAGLFPAVDSRMKFCLLTLTGPNKPVQAGAEFVFFAHRTQDLLEQYRRFTLDVADLALLNPNTRTCPIFRSKKDAELTKAIYRRVPVLIKEGPPEENPWGIKFSRMFDMSNNSHLFRTREQLEEEGWHLEGNIFKRGKETYLPLYEAKLLHQFNHRWATYEGLETRDLTGLERINPNTFVLPRYWVASGAVEEQLKEKWKCSWLLAFRDITNTTNKRTVIACILPRIAVGHKAPLIIFENQKDILFCSFLACLSSFALDFMARFKVGGTNLTFFIFKQLVVLPPAQYLQPAWWAKPQALKLWIMPRVLELAYTAWDLKPFARDCGYQGPPFRWDEERRFLIRCELDAAFFHLYGIERDDVDYIMETFPIVKRKDEARYGSYRTKEAILDIYDRMTAAMDTGVPYQTMLNPPPGPSQVWPPPPGTPWPSHIHPPREG